MLKKLGIRIIDFFCIHESCFDENLSPEELKELEDELYKKGILKQRVSQIDKRIADEIYTTK